MARSKTVRAKCTIDPENEFKTFDLSCKLPIKTKKFGSLNRLTVSDIDRTIHDPF